MENKQFELIMAAIMEVKEKVVSLENAVGKLEGSVEKLEEGFESLKADHIELKEKVDRIDRTVMKIELEHGEKLQALFDAFQLNSEKINDNKKDLESCKYRLDKHDDEIYYLNSKVQGL